MTSIPSFRRQADSRLSTKRSEIARLLPSIAALCVLLAGAYPGFAQTWTQTSAPVTNWQAVASSADGTKLVAVTGAGPIYTSTNSGMTWAPSSAPLTNWSAVASSADGTKLLAAGGATYAGPIYISADSGVSWTQSSAPIKYWRAVASSADGMRLVAGGEPFSFYISTNGGGTWTQSYAGDYGEAMLSVASSADGTRLFAGGCVCQIAHLGAIYTSADSGATWVPTSVQVYTPSIAASADGTRVVVAENGTVYTSTDSGATWTTNQLGNARAVASSADASKLIAGDYISTNSGTSWAPSGAPDSWVSIASSADGTKLVAAGSHGGIYTWQSTPAPVLHIASMSTDLVLSWIEPSIYFVLQQNLDLVTTNWIDLTNTPTLNFTNLQNQLTLPNPPGGRFYRLKIQ